MGSLFMVAAVAMGLAASSSAFAETVFTEKQTREIAYKFGKCVVSRHAGGASKAILRNADNEELRRHYSALIDPGCLNPGGRLIFPGDFYRYALADALVARELATVPAPDLTNVPPLDHGAVPIPPVAPPTYANAVDKFRYQVALKKAQETQTFRTLRQYGECVVRESPANAKALLMTEPVSPGESDRFEALQPALSACAATETMRVSKFLLRGAIALSYYRLAQAALHVPVR